VLFTLGILEFLAEAALVDAGVGGGALLVFLFDMAVAYYVGQNGNGWRRARLAEQGFQYIKSTQAGSPAKAVSQVAAEALVASVAVETDT
jgi:hypothetical protein